MPQLIYLDNSTTTCPSDESISKMMPFLTQFWGNFSAPHQKGQELFKAIEEGYLSIYELLGAKTNDDVIFTSSGAEAVNQVISSTLHHITQDLGKNHYITSNIDEAPVIMAMGHLESLGCVNKIANADTQGKITAEIIAEMITPRTALVSLSWANGLTGVINPVAEIGDLCRLRGILFHLDATHILGKIFYELEDIGASFISFNGDHLHSPKGSGALYIKEGVKCRPLIFGGNEQGGYRSGPLNVASLAALGCAAKQTLEGRDFVCTEIARLRNKLEEGIINGFPAAISFFQDQERLPHITAIGFPGIANEAMLFALNRKGVCASIGGGNFQQIGLILIGSGVNEKLAHTALSFSLSRYTTESEVDKAVNIIVETAKKLSKTSQYLNINE